MPHVCSGLASSPRGGPGRAPGRLRLGPSPTETRRGEWSRRRAGMNIALLADRSEPEFSTFVAQFGEPVYTALYDDKVKPVVRAVFPGLPLQTHGRQVWRRLPTRRAVTSAREQLRTLTVMPPSEDGRVTVTGCRGRVLGVSTHDNPLRARAQELVPGQLDESGKVKLKWETGGRTGSSTGGDDSSSVPARDNHSPIRRALPTSSESVLTPRGDH